MAECSELLRLINALRPEVVGGNDGDSNYFFIHHYVVEDGSNYFFIHNYMVEFEEGHEHC